MEPSTVYLPEAVGFSEAVGRGTVPRRVPGIRVRVRRPAGGIHPGPGPGGRACGAGDTRDVDGFRDSRGGINQ